MPTATSKTPCPRCGGRKSLRAELCRACTPTQDFAPSVGTVRGGPSASSQRVMGETIMAHRPKAQVVVCASGASPNGRHWWAIGQDNHGACRYCGEIGYFPSRHIWKA